MAEGEISIEEGNSPDRHRTRGRSEGLPVWRPRRPTAADNAILIAAGSRAIKTTSISSCTETRPPVCMDSAIRDYRQMTALTLGNEHPSAQGCVQSALYSIANFYGTTDLLPFHAVMPCCATFVYLSLYTRVQHSVPSVCWWHPSLRLSEGSQLIPDCQLPVWVRGCSEAMVNVR